MSWGVTLWDQFKNLSSLSQRSIDFYEKFSHFVKERCDIENEYAAKLKKLAKSYQPKKDEEQSLSWMQGFVGMLKEHNDIANQHENIAEELMKKIHQSLLTSAKELKETRRKLVQEQAKQESAVLQALQQLDKTKKQYEKSFKDGEKAVEYFNKLDKDPTYPRIDVDKAKDNMDSKRRQCDECKGSYASDLQKANTAQRDYYTQILPNLILQLQTTEEQRITQTKQYISLVAQAERAVIPIIQKCIDGIVQASELVDASKDSQTVISRFESGNSPPTDLPFEDLGVPGDSTYESSKVKPTSAYHNLTVRGKAKIKELPKEDFSNLPPAQQKKKLQEKLKTLSSDIAKETAQRDALSKMMDVYTQNPKMGDVKAVEKQLVEQNSKLEKLMQEHQKFSAYLAAADDKAPAPPALSTMFAAKAQPQSTASSVPMSKQPSVNEKSLMHEDSFDDDEEKGAVGTCRALYQLEASGDGSISLTEGEEFQIVDKDQGDGWTMVRNKAGQEGFAPTSYLEIHLY